MTQQPDLPGRGIEPLAPTRDLPDSAGELPTRDRTSVDQRLPLAYRQQQPPLPRYPTVVVAGPYKNVGLAAVLGFFFGPLGLLYATVGGALLLFLLNVVVALLTMGFGLVLTWPLAAIWGAVAANQHNARIRAVATRYW